MKLRYYLLIMSAATAFCWLVFGYVVWTVNPEATNAIGFWLFYLSLFLALTGTAAIVGFLIRFVFLRREQIIDKACLSGRQVKIAFRQSFLFSGFIVASLFLLSRDLLTWLNLLILIVALSVLEFFLLSYGRSTDVSGQNDEKL